MSMSKDRAIAKIRKCLALSESSEPHEAARAMAQANALLKKYQLEFNDVNQPEIVIESLATSYRRYPVWMTMLCNVVSRAFGCTVYTGPKSILFAGEPPAPELSKFCFIQLQHSLESATKLSLIEHSALNAGAKKKSANAFRVGWIIGVNKSVSAFASSVTDKQKESHDSAVSEMTGAPVGERKATANTKPRSIAELKAQQAGFDAGKKVNIRHGVTGEKPAKLLGSSA